MPTYDAEKCKRLIQRKFDFLLNAMERAAAEENPCHHDYRGKCAAVHEHVAELKDQLFAATQEIERLTRENEALNARYTWPKLRAELARLREENERLTRIADLRGDEVAKWAHESGVAKGQRDSALRETARLRSSGDMAIKAMRWAMGVLANAEISDECEVHSEMIIGIDSLRMAIDELLAAIRLAAEVEGKEQP